MPTPHPAHDLSNVVPLHPRRGLPHAIPFAPAYEGRSDAQRFADALFGDLGADAWIELRVIDPGRPGAEPHRLTDASRFGEAVEKVGREHPGANVYVGAAARAIEHKSGSRAHLAWATAAWVDLDCYGEDPAAKLEQLHAAGWRPSIAVHSGAGLHLYFLFDGPLDIRPQGKLTGGLNRLEAINRGLAEDLGGDKAWDAARILRPPCTVNYPDAKKRAKGRTEAPVRLLRCEPAQRYPLAWFASIEEKGRRLVEEQRAPAAGADYERGDWGEDELPPRVAAALQRDAKAAARFEGDADGLGDPSASSVDMSLASRLALHGMEAAEIDHALRLKRARLGEAEKHDGYYALTVSKALANRPGGPGFPDPRPADGDAPQRRPKRKIDVTRQRDDVANDCVRAVVEQNDPPTLFLRAGQLVEARVDGGRPVLHQLSAATVDDALMRSADFLKPISDEDGKSTKWIAADIPRRIPGAAYQRLLKSPDLPRVAGVVDYPVMRADGTVLTESGYDPDTQLYAHLPDDVEIRVPDVPTDEEVRTAADVLLDVLADFPFVDEASQAHALTRLLVLPLRNLVEGQVPLYAVDATDAGTGKGLLVDAALTVARGKRATPLPPVSGEEEWRKRIASIVVEGRDDAMLDNVEGPLRSASLCAVLTAGEFGDRVLGVTKMVAADHSTVWTATGNNLEVKGDLLRRTCWIRMDAKRARPDQRKDFRYEDLLGWIRANRGPLLSAAFTLGRAWVLRGRPGPHGTDAEALGSFEGWRRAMGGVLEVAGVPGFLANRADQFREMDQDREAWGALLDDLWWALPDGWTSTARMADVIRLDRALQARRIAAEVEKVKAAVAQAREGEERIRGECTKRLAKIRSTYLGLERDLGARIALRERGDLLRAHLDEAGEKIGAHAYEAARMLAAAKEVADRHLTPKAMLRGAVHGPGGRTLDAVEASTYRASKLAEFNALGPLAFEEALQAALDANDLIAVGAAADALERRTDVELSAADVLSRVELPPDLQARVDDLREVEERGLELAAEWAGYAEPDRPQSGSGRQRIQRSLGGASPIDGALAELQRLAKLRPEDQRDLSDGVPAEPQKREPTGEARLATTFAAGNEPTAA